MIMSQPPRPTPAPWVERESFIEAFEAAHRADPRAQFEAFVPPPEHPLRLIVLEELIRIDLEHGWLRGQPRWLENYFHRYPELLEASAAVRTLAFEEFRLRRRAGHTVTADEYRRRFGVDPSRGIRDDWPDPIRAPATPKPAPDRFAQLTTAMPRAGDRLGGFQLTAELGTGAFGRVFLAHSKNRRRPAAIKVSPRLAGEAPALVRLRHPHIVPIRLMFRTESVHAVVMPYRGAVTLGHIRLDYDADSLPASGRSLFAMKRPGFPLAISRRPSLHAALVKANYVDASLWLVARLAEGLAHAHGRGLLHCDLKPPNILIADDGSPMLLDFHLATDIRFCERPWNSHAGGTLAYMAPEQLDNFLGHRRAIDARADLYGLGVVLFQLLTGRMPYPVPPGLSMEQLTATRLARLRPAPPVRSINLQAPRAAETLVDNLLQPDPEHRPPTAAVVRDQLDALVPNLQVTASR
jgi:serine/threonine protein kinase